MSSETGFSVDPGVLIGVLVVVLGLLIVYFVLLVRALIEMIRFNAPGVMITFTYLSLIPFPLFLILGILNVVIWRFVRKDLAAQRSIAT